MNGRTTLVFILVVCAGLSGVAGVAVADDTNVTAENESVPENDAEQVDDSVSTIVLDVSASLDVYRAEYHDDGSIDIYVDSDVRQSVQIIEERNDGGWVEEHYSVDEGQTRITYTPQYGNTDRLGIRSGHDRAGNYLEDPTASPLSFDRNAQWSDHWVTGGTVVVMVFSCVIYRYKRRDFFAKNELRSLLSERTYRRNKSEEGWQYRALWHFYSPKSLLVGIIGLLIVEILTGFFSEHLASMTTEMQLGFLVTIIGLPAYYYVAGQILALMPISNKRQMLALDNREMGGVDVLEGAKEWFDGMKVKGAKQLAKRPITGTQDKVYVAHHYEPETHTAVSTWHEILDAVAVARNYTAAFVNYHFLDNEVDEAREIKYAQPALRQQYQTEAQDVSMKKMDQTHFPDQKSTNDVMAGGLDNLDYDEEVTVDTTEEVTNDEESDSEESEGDDE